MASPSPSKNKDSVSVSASSLLSSSPPIPNRPNPKPRNSETGDPMRRSFRGSPFPADLSRRNSTGRVEYGGDKENQNDKDHQFSNVVKAPKGAKNFMSPTISAVSKINPSPRKKVLSDKNEVSRSFDRTNHHHQVKSCVSFSDVISIMGEDKDREQICIDEKKQLVEEKVESYDITVTDYVENHENKKSNGDFDDFEGFKISPRPPSVPYTFPVFESQEVDPLVAPYDPKNNYLSPRPQFLHYKPNPRIEHHFDECKQLEELFISESSSSDTDLSAEESQQEEEEEEEVVVAVDETLKIQDEDGEELLEEAEIEKDEEEEVVGESVEEETQTVPKQSRFKISKLFGLVLALGVAYLLLVSSGTLPQPSISEASPFNQFHIPPEITKSARESFEQLSKKLEMWAGSSLVYLDKLISSLGDEEGYGTFQFHNLTDVLEDTRLSDAVFKPSGGDEISVAELLVDSQDWSLEVDVEEENGDHQEPENGGETNLEAVYEEMLEESEGGEAHSEVAMEINGGEGYSVSEEENGSQVTDCVDIEGQRVSEEINQNNIDEVESEAQQLDDVESVASSGGHPQDVESVVPEQEAVGEIAGSGLGMSVEEESGIGEVVDAAGSEEMSDVNGESGLGEAVDVSGLEEMSDVDGESGIDEVIDAAGLEEVSLSNSSDQKKVVVLFSTVMVVIVAAAAAFWLSKKKANKPVVIQNVEVDEPTATTAAAATLEHVPVANLIKEKISSMHFQEEVVVVDDEMKREVSSSFPSETSFSFHKNKPFLQSCSNNNKNRDDDDLQSGGKKSNDSGESMASSASEYSMGSVSYGSFTTYEKIQKKSGRKEAQEMVTPVRRSSRIRSQHSGQ